MKKSLPLLLALLSVYLALPSLAGSGPTPAPPQNVVRTTVALADGGSPIWYVDVRGLDTNACTAPFTDGGSDGPCRQPQAAINKVPKMLKQPATLSIDAGVYNGILVTGFLGDVSGPGGILIDGVLTTSTLASGPATGTATSGTAGSGSTFGTLVLTGAGWTANDLTGRFITTASPTNAQFVVSSNTVDTITVVGPWGAPTASTTFTIQDPATVFNSVMVPPGTPISLASTRGTILSYGNSLDSRRQQILFRNLRLEIDAGFGISIDDSSGVVFTNVQVVQSIASGGGAVAVGGLGGVGGDVAFTKCHINQPTSTNSAVSFFQGKVSSANSLFRQGAGTNPVLSLNNGSGGSAFVFSITASEFRGSQTALLISSNASPFHVFTNSRLSCAAAGGAGLRLGLSASTDMPAFGTLASSGGIDISGCSTAIQIRGLGVLNFTGALSGSALTTGVEASFGAMLGYTKASVTLTAPTEISLDPASIVPVTSTFAGVTTNSCVATAAAGYYSKACAR